MPDRHLRDGRRRLERRSSHGRPCFPNTNRCGRPDGGRIAFARSLGDPQLSHPAIFTMDPDGTDVRQVSSADGGSDFWPSWSPDGSADRLRDDPERGLGDLDRQRGWLERGADLRWGRDGIREQPGLVAGREPDRLRRQSEHRRLQPGRRALRDASRRLGHHAARRRAEHRRRRGHRVATHPGTRGDGRADHVAPAFDRRGRRDVRGGPRGPLGRLRRGQRLGRSVEQRRHVVGTHLPDRSSRPTISRPRSPSRSSRRGRSVAERWWSQRAACG